MVSSSEGNDIWGIFRNLWDGTEKEIFRLQLLNSYAVEDEAEQFKRYLRGQPIELSEEDKEWIKNIEKKRILGTKNINLIVIDLPLSDYLKFAISTGFYEQQKAGRETLMVERKDVSGLITGFQDYWMFDSKDVILMSYDNAGHFLGARTLDPAHKDISKYVRLRDELVKNAIPMAEFLSERKINIVPQKSKN